MKKIFIIILSCLFIILAISFLKIHITKVNNQNIINEIKKIKKDNERLDENNLNSENEINVLREEKKTKWEELKNWENTKSKIEKALSQ